MLGLLSNLYSLSLVLALTALLVVGIVEGIELLLTIFPTSVTSVSSKVAEGLYRIVLLATVVYSMIAILLQLIGGGINAH